MRLSVRTLAAAALGLTTLLGGCATDDPLDPLNDDSAAVADESTALALGAFDPIQQATCDVTPANLVSTWPSGQAAVGAFVRAWVDVANLCGKQSVQLDAIPNAAIDVRLWEQEQSGAPVTGDRLVYDVYAWKPGQCFPHSTFCTLARWAPIASGAALGASAWNPAEGSFDSVIAAAVIRVPAGHTAIRAAVRVTKPNGNELPVNVTMRVVP